ncbi:hypothetical protein [Streptomyces sp. NBC_01012]|uniref:hypothetical protein n=1 Tax=Streptomyces sp. NBC_01012 TaxID=2903717 RepID=UPI00386DBE25|nr:hypothetical protein OG623_25960 [Streptomyces sp. NBC_01012]
MYAIGFLEGFGAHVLDLARAGIHAYAPFHWVPLQAFFVALVVLDPLVVVLVVLVRRAGVWLAGAVMVMDVCANWAGNWHWLKGDPAGLLHLDGLLVINLFGLFVIASVLPLQHAMVQLKPDSRPGEARRTTARRRIPRTAPPR